MLFHCSILSLLFKGKNATMRREIVAGGTEDRMWKVLLVTLIILIIVLVVLYFLGRKLEKRQAENQAQLNAMAQTVSMLIIDKTRLPVKKSGLPQMVIDQTPKLLRRSKLPIVKAKVGPKISILIADEKVFDLIPVKKEIKAEVSGLYIVGVKGIRGNLEAPAKKKKGFFARFKKSAEEAQAAQTETKKSKKKK